MFVCTLCPCLTSFPEWNWDANYSTTKFPLARHITCTRNLIPLRKQDTAIFSELWKEIHFYLTCCRYAIWMNWQSEFVCLLFVVVVVVVFYRAVLPDLSDSRRIGPKINPPKFFPWRINVRIGKCLCLVYLSYHRLNCTFSHLTVWTARPALYACGT